MTHPRVIAYLVCGITLICIVALVRNHLPWTSDAPVESWWETQTRAKIDAYASGNPLLRFLVAQATHVVLDQTRTVWCINVTRHASLVATLSADEARFQPLETERGHEQRVSVLLDERWARIKDKFPKELRGKRDYTGIELCWGPAAEQDMDYGRRRP